MKKRNWYLTFGCVLTACMLVFTAVGFLWTPYDPGALSLRDKLAKPSGEHLFGCDQLGRDILSRTLDGAGNTLIIALAVLAVGFVFGLLIGALCGYYGGAVDAAVMRVCDAITAFPSILLAMVVIAIIGPGTYNIIAALGILFIPSFARLVRGEFIKYRGRDFVHAARLEGVPALRIIFVHILPNTRAVILPTLVIGFNNAVLAEASLSYLGIGVRSPDVSLGYMLSESQSYMATAPWYVLCTGATIVLLILGFSLLGEGLQQGRR
jgi:peptide/nickel transport system permease protein